MAVVTNIYKLIVNFRSLKEIRNSRERDLFVFTNEWLVSKMGQYDSFSLYILSFLLKFLVQEKKIKKSDFLFSIDV